MSDADDAPRSGLILYQTEESLEDLAREFPKKRGRKRNGDGVAS